MLLVFCHSILLFSILRLSLSADPGVKMRVTQKWMDYIRITGMEVLQDMLQNEHLPDITGTTRMFGQVEYSITGLTVDTFEFHNTSATRVPRTNIDVSIVNASAKAHGNWKVKHWLINDRGGFTLDLSGVNIAATVTTFKDNSNRPSIFIAKCQSHVKGASIKFSGAISWLYNLFSVFLEKPICNILSKKLCPRVAEALKILQHELSTFRVRSQMDAFAEVDYSLLEPPAVTVQHIDLDLKGMVHPIGNPAMSNSPLHPIPLASDNNSMLHIGLSEDFFNSVGFTYFSASVLEYFITDGEVPNMPWLKTSDYRVRMPEMSYYYPESRPVMMKISATKVPVVTLTADTLHLQLFGFLTAFAFRPDSNAKPIFSLKLEVHLSTSDLWVSDFNLTGSFSLNRFQLSSISSNVGVVSDAALEEPVHFIISSVVLPALNEGLRNGIPMPSLANISLKDTKLQINQGSMLISTDMIYVPWNSLKRRHAGTAD